MKSADIILQKVDSSSELKFQPIQVSKSYKLCIKTNKYENFVREEFGDDIFCQESIAQELKKTSSTKKALPKAEIRIRSTSNIFEFLGQVVKAQLADPPYMLTLPPTSTTFNSNKKTSNEYALLVVDKDKPQPRPFSAIEGLDGSMYSIPSQNNGYSPIAIKLLAQFMSLQKIPGSIPASPSVLLR